MGLNVSVPINSDLFGFRIYKLVPNGPLSKAKIKEIEDFIIPPKEIYEKNIPFDEWIKSNANKLLTLEIYSILKRKFFYIEIQTNPEGSKEGYLGASVRYENFIDAHKKVLHVLEIKKDSFADKILKLEENNDYLIAIKPEKGDILSLNSKNDVTPLELFTEMIKFNIGKECEFYIYNVKNGARFVKCKIPDDEFFELGCNVAYGKIHEFPIDENEDKTQINGNLIDI
jgi:hypothetical protein